MRQVFNHLGDLQFFLIGDESSDVHVLDADVEVISDLREKGPCRYVLFQHLQFLRIASVVVEYWFGLKRGDVANLAGDDELCMNELLLQAFYLVLEIFDRLDEEFIAVIKDYQHLLASDLVQTVPVVRVAEFGDFVELVAEHVLVPDVIEVDEEVDLVDSSLDEVGGCFYGEGSLANPWMAIQEE